MSTANFAYQNLSFGDLVAAAATSGAAAISATVNIPTGRLFVMTGLYITGVGATAATVVSAQTAGFQSNFPYIIAVPAGVTTSITPVFETFLPGIPSTVGATACNISVPSFGAGNTNVSCALWGFFFPIPLQ